MQTKFICRLLCTILSIWVPAAGCMTGRHTQTSYTTVKTKTLVGEYDHGWLKYKIYQMPSPDSGTGKSAKASPVVFSIMVINMQDGVSPLRKLCSNLDQYNIYYEYLMNQTKNDLVLINGNTILYPVYYAFENNYNAFPFETINVGYQPDFKKRDKDSKMYSLVYIDRIFSKDTIRCNLTTTPFPTPKTHH